MSSSFLPSRVRYLPRPILTALVILTLTSLVGSLWSAASISAVTTNLRSRLPGAALTQLTTAGGPNHVIDPTTLNLVAPPTLPYFADKRNLFNQYFVKFGWAWTSLVWLVQTVATLAFTPRYIRSSKSGRPTTPLRATLGSIRRFVLASLVWFYLTQKTWFVGLGTGPSLMQRLLVRSGALCMPPPGVAELSCSGRKGEYWHGGHDVSGHTFMMILATMTLVETVAPVLPSVLPSLLDKYLAPRKRPDAVDLTPASQTQTATAPSVAMASAKVVGQSNGSGSVVEGEDSKERAHTHVVLELATVLTLAFVGLWWGMLLTTSLYFHTFDEKMSGLAAGLLGWFASNL